MTNDIGVKLDVAANAAAMKALRLHWKEGEIYQSIYSTRTIKAGEVIEGSALEVRFGSLHSIESDSFISSKQQLVGRLALNEIPPGQQVSVDGICQQLLDRFTSEFSVA